MTRRLAVAALCCTLAAAPSTGERRVSGHVITSTRGPRVRVALPSESTYVGSDHWVLFGIANCDLYAFVRADTAKRVRALYWVQFEGYLPSMPRLHHIYASTRRAKIGGVNFIVDTWTESNPRGVHAPDTSALAAAIRAKGYRVAAGLRSGSDEQHLYALLRAKGYRMPANVMAVRLVHLADAQKREELMIIYSEPLDEASRAGLLSRAERQIIVRPF